MLHLLEQSDWHKPFSSIESAEAVKALESGRVLYLPHLDFKLKHDEKRLLSPDVLGGKAKNVSFDPVQNQLKRTTCSGEKAQLLKNMMSRFSKYSALLLEHVLPLYHSGMQVGRTSYRPVEIESRESSAVKDDTRLHVDAFPATPNGGRRILRVFTNVNPFNQSRHWHLGEPFQAVADRFVPSLKGPIIGTRKLLALLKLTKSYRSLYDHYMLLLHDTMKLDEDYQTTVSKTAVQFPPGATWIVFTDSVSHAALRGQFILEQTFYLPVENMQNPSFSPLHILEGKLGAALV